MAQSEGLTYKKSGVDITEGNKIKEKIISHIESTWEGHKIVKPRGFVGIRYEPERNEFIVSSMDGVGTKCLVASMSSQYDMLGVDAVASNVNDMVVYGSITPLLFMDYMAIERYEEGNKLASVARGMCLACKVANYPLIQGETAALPGIIKKDALDVVGTAVGRTKVENMFGQIKKNKELMEWLPYNINEGDVIIGLPSSGLHCNGYTLARLVFFKKLKKDIHEWIPEFCSSSAQELLKPTRIYSNIINKLIEEFGTASKISCNWINKNWELKYSPKKGIKGVAHITGSGFNKILNVIPEDLGVLIKKGTWPIPPVFEYIREKGNISEQEMINTFNMGIGMVLIAEKDLAQKVVSFLENIASTPSPLEKIEGAYTIGTIFKKTTKKGLIIE